MSTFSEAKVEEMLPHRHPFLFVDRINVLEPGRAAEGLFQVPESHPLLNRERDVPFLPPILVVEALGQVASICIGSSQGHVTPGTSARGYLVRIDQCSFYDTVNAGEILVLEARLIARYAPLYKFDASGRVGEKRVAKALVTLHLEL